MAARNFLELQMNFIRHDDVLTSDDALLHSRKGNVKVKMVTKYCVVADHLSQHPTQQDTYLATMLEKKR